MAFAIPWANVLTQVGDNDTTKNIMAACGLNWSCEEDELRTVTGGLIVPKHKAIIRSDNKNILGVVTKGYELLQNVEVMAIVDELRQKGCSIVGAGTTDDGHSIFVQCRYPEGGEVVPNDPVQPYFTVINFHDGSGSVRIGMTVVRIVCSNTQRAAALDMAGEERVYFSLRHTKSLHERVDEAVQAINWGHIAFQGFMDAAKRLPRHEVGNDDILRQFFMDTFGITDKDLKKKGTRIEDRLERLQELFVVGEGHDNPHVKNTWWAAYNAVTQYLDHEAPTRVAGGVAKMTDEQQLAAKRTARFVSGAIGNNAAIKDRAFQKALELATAA